MAESRAARGPRTEAKTGSSATSTSTDGALPCPSCGGEMARRRFEGHYGRTGEVDFCEACRGVWFDGQELLALTPAATLELVARLGGGQEAVEDATVEDAVEDARRPLAARLGCPRCRSALRLTHDRQRDTRFAYHRCPEGHGRFLTCFQFLQAKGLVRTLAGRELAELAAQVKQIRCSNCGAPVDLAKGAVCVYCRTPAAVLDPEAIEKALAEFRAAEEARTRPLDPTLPLRLATERLRVERTFAALEHDGGWLALAGGREGDLVLAGLKAMFGWLGGRRG
ncbi:MAG: zf-TFIIB domain-containing protein [Thermoanaerobaculia bacterium]|nr:zf-TFIIB domain-containing protein [Thermoanaerobaculia bacterium]